MGTTVLAGLNPSDPQNLTAVTVEPSGKFAYVTVAGSNKVLAYSINPTSGALTPITGATPVAPARQGPVSIALAKGLTPVTYTPKFAYVGNYNSGDISTFSINASTGALSSLGAPVPSVASLFVMAVDPFNKFVYAAGGGDEYMYVHSINPSTGALSSRTAVTVQVTYSAAIESSGRFLYAAALHPSAGWGIFAYAIDPATGSLTSVGSAVSMATIPFMAVDQSSQFIYATSFDYDNISVYKIDPNTGAVANVGAVAVTNPRQITVAPSGRFVYAVTDYDGVLIFTINPLTGELTSAGSMASFFGSIAFEPSGRFAYANGPPPDSFFGPAFYSLRTCS